VHAFTVFEMITLLWSDIDVVWAMAIFPAAI